MDFLYMIDMLHCDIECSRERTAAQLKELAETYGAYKEKSFDKKVFLKHFSRKREYKSLILLFWAHVWDRNYFK